MKTSQLFLLALVAPALLAVSADQCIEINAHRLTPEGQRRLTTITGKDVVLLEEAHFAADPTPVYGQDQMAPVYSKVAPTMSPSEGRVLQRKSNTTTSKKTTHGKNSTTTTTTTTTKKTRVTKSVIKDGKSKVIYTKDNEEVTIDVKKDGTVVAEVIKKGKDNKVKPGATVIKTVKTADGTASVLKNPDGTTAVVDKKKNCTAYSYNECMKYCTAPVRNKVTNKVECPGKGYKKLCKGEKCNLWKNTIASREVAYTYNVTETNPEYNDTVGKVNKLVDDINESGVALMRLRKKSVETIKRIKRTRTTTYNERVNKYNKDQKAIVDKYNKDNAAMTDRHNKAVKEVTDLYNRNVVDYNNLDKKEKKALDEKLKKAIDGFHRAWAARKKNIRHSRNYNKDYAAWKKKWQAEQDKIKAALGAAYEQWKLVWKKTYETHTGKMKDLRDKLKNELKKLLISRENNEKALEKSWKRAYTIRQTEIQTLVAKEESSFKRRMLDLQNRLEAAKSAKCQEWQKKFMQYVRNKKEALARREKEYLEALKNAKDTMEREVKLTTLTYEKTIKTAKEANMAEQAAKVKAIEARRAELDLDLKRKLAKSKAAKAKKEADFEKKKREEIRKMTTEIEIKTKQAGISYEKDIEVLKAKTQERLTEIQKEYEMRVKNTKEELEKVTEQAKKEYAAIMKNHDDAFTREQAEKLKKLREMMKQAHGKQQAKLLDEINKIKKQAKDFGEASKAKAKGMVNMHNRSLEKRRKELCEEYKATNEKLLKELRAKYTTVSTRDTSRVRKIYDGEGNLVDTIRTQGEVIKTTKVDEEKVQQEIDRYTAEHNVKYKEEQAKSKAQLNTLLKEWKKGHVAQFAKYKAQLAKLNKAKDEATLAKFIAAGDKIFKQQAEKCKATLAKKLAELEKELKAKIAAIKKKYAELQKKHESWKTKTTTTTKAEQEKKIAELKAKAIKEKEEIERIRLEEIKKITTLYDQKIKAAKNNFSASKGAKKDHGEKAKELENEKDKAIKYLSDKITTVVKTIEETFTRKVDAIKKNYEAKRAALKLAHDEYKKNLAKIIKEEARKTAEARDAAHAALENAHNAKTAEEKKVLKTTIETIRTDTEWNKMMRGKNSAKRAELAKEYAKEKTRIEKLYKKLFDDADKKLAEAKLEWEAEWKRRAAKFQLGDEKKDRDEFSKRWNQMVKEEVEKLHSKHNSDFKKAKKKCEEDLDKQRKDLEDKLNKIKNAHINKFTKSKNGLIQKFNKDADDLRKKVEKARAAQHAEIQAFIKKFQIETTTEINHTSQVIGKEISRIEAVIKTKKETLDLLKKKLEKTPKTVTKTKNGVKTEQYTKKVCDNWARAGKITNEREHCISRDESNGMPVCLKLDTKTGKCTKETKVYPFESCELMKVTEDDKKKFDYSEHVCLKHIRVYPRFSCNTVNVTINGKSVCPDRKIVKPSMFCKEYKMVGNTRKCARKDFFYGSGTQFTCLKTGKVIVAADTGLSASKSSGKTKEVACQACLDYEKKTTTEENTDAFDFINDVSFDLGARVLFEVPTTSDAELVGRQLHAFSTRDRRVLKRCVRA